MRRLVLAFLLSGLILAAVGAGPAAAAVPVVTTGAASAITPTTATVAGTVNPGGLATTYDFEYGTTTAYGQTTAPVAAGAAAADVPVTGALTGLTASTTYHFRISATNTSGTVTGADQTFATAGAAAAQTGPASAIAASSATLTGSVTPAAASPTTYFFQYGTTNAYGLQTPTLGISEVDASPLVAIPVSAGVTGLTAATTYHYRIMAVYGSTNVPGADQVFVTPGTAAPSTLGVVANPAGGNSDVATTLNIGSDPAGTPVGQATAIGEAFSSQFVSQQASFGACAAASFNNAQGPTAATCPDRSAILGVGSLITRDQTGAQSTSDQGYLVKTSDNRVVFWWHNPAVGATPATFGEVPGAISQETGLFGPVVTYDFSGLPAGARVKQLAITYQRNAATGKAPFVATTCSGRSWQFQARVVYAGGAAPEVPTTTVPCGAAVAPQPSKLQLARATITGRVIDILAPISRRASGNVSLDLYSAGRHSTWSAPINSVDGRIRNTHVLPASQARNGGTGILTIRYAGNAVTRPQVVRLRAGSVPAVLDAARPTLDGAGHLAAHGTVSTQAHGVVRVQLEYYSGGTTTTLERYATISNGAWSLNVTLTAAQQAAIAARQGPVESYILFTGYFPRRMRGEMIAYQVLGA